MLYQNGQVPLDVVSVVLGSGKDSLGRYWEHRLTPAMAKRWAYAVAYAKHHFGHSIYIKSGANAYRDLAWQKIGRDDACAQGNCLGAAYPGTSSHGGNWSSRDCLAIDVNPGWDANGSQILSWEQVWEACTAAGFACNLITPQISGRKDGEPWHVIDFNAFGPVPSDLNVSDFNTTTIEEADMPIHIQREKTGVTWTVQPGVYIKHHPDATNSRIANYLTTGTDRETNSDFKVLGEGDLSIAIWDLGFPELGGDITKLPANGATYFRPVGTMPPVVVDAQGIASAVINGIAQKLQ